MPLDKKSTIGTWIKDFKKSDAPQFKGKNEKERRDMAIAAYLNKEEFVYEDLQRDAEVRQKKQDRKEQDIERIKGMISRHQCCTPRSRTCRQDGLQRSGGASRTRFHGMGGIRCCPGWRGDGTHPSPIRSRCQPCCTDRNRWGRTDTHSR